MGRCGFTNHQVAVFCSDKSPSIHDSCRVEPTTAGDFQSALGTFENGIFSVCVSRADRKLKRAGEVDTKRGPGHPEDPKRVRGECDDQSRWQCDKRGHLTSCPT